MQEILPGIRHWTAEHPDIHYEVSSYYLADAAAVLDPMVPPEGFEALGDRPVEQLILTNRLHGRQSEQFAERYGARVRAPRVGLHQFEGRPYAVEPYDWGEELAPGVTALEVGAICPDDGVLHLHGTALAFADAVLVMGGELRLMPDELMDEPETVKERSYARLRELLELDFGDALLLAHSDPVVSGARARLEALLA